jgi:hypothetical protein
MMKKADRKVIGVAPKPGWFWNSLFLTEFVQKPEVSEQVD